MVSKVPAQNPNRESAVLVFCACVSTVMLCVYFGFLVCAVFVVYSVFMFCLCLFCAVFVVLLLKRKRKESNASKCSDC